MPEPPEQDAPMPCSPEPVLSIDDLSVSFAERGGGRTRAVRGVSIDLSPGRTTAVVGESGSGKSVTALSVLRLLQTPPARIDTGRITLRRGVGDSVDLLSCPDEEIRAVRGNEIAMIFQEPMTSLNPVINVGDQIIEAVRLHRDVSKKDARGIALRALRDVGIDRGEPGLAAYPHEFSGGMRQRVMIAIALACEPGVLIADEPTTALDVTVQAQILDLLDRLKRERRLAVMLITHDLGLVAEHADAVSVMYAGRVVEAGPIAAVLDSPVHPYTQGLLAAAPSLESATPRLATVDAFMSDPARFEILISGEQCRAWWPTARSGSGRSEGDDGVMREVEPGHHARTARPSSGELSTENPRRV